MIATPLGLVVMCTGMATVRRLNGTDISITDGGDVTTVGGEDTGVIRDSHWRDACMTSRATIARGQCDASAQ